MPRGPPFIVEHFIIPALRERKYPDTLQWVLEEQGIFRLKLSHKNNRSWDQNCVRIFQDWDILKRRPCGAKGYDSTQAKQRFKNGLSKCKCAKKLDEATLKALHLDKNKNSLYYKYEPASEKKCIKRKKSAQKPTSRRSRAYASPPLTPPSSPENNGTTLRHFPSSNENNPSTLGHCDEPMEILPSDDLMLDIIINGTVPVHIEDVDPTWENYLYKL